MLPLGIFRSVQFSAANAITFVVYAALGGALFLLPVMLQGAVGYTPLQSGLALLPVTVIMLALSSRSGALAAGSVPGCRCPWAAGHRRGVPPDPDRRRRGLPHAGAARRHRFRSGACDQCRSVDVDGDEGRPAEHAGVASAVDNDVARIAALLAVAVLPVVAGITGDAYLQPDVLLTGFRTAVLISAVLCAAGGLLAALTIRNPKGGEGPPHPHPRELHCALDAPPLRGDDHVVDAVARWTGDGTSEAVRRW